MRHKRPRTSGSSTYNNKDTNVATLAKLHPVIVCRLCRGYIIDCITIVECMHSFCRSCIVKYLNDQDERYDCPKCGQIIHETNPWTYLAPDSALQTIIYKLVPGLQETEARRFAEYYRRRGMSPPRKDQETASEKSDIKEGQHHRSKKNESRNAAETVVEKPSDNNKHRLDEQISVHLISGAPVKQQHNNSMEDNGSGPGELVAQQVDAKVLRPFLRLSCFATVNHLRKYLAYRLYGDLDRYADFDLYCEGRPLYKEHTLKFIAATVWGRVVDQSEKDSIDLVMPIVYRNRTAATTASSDGATDEDDAAQEEKEDDSVMSDATALNSNSVSSPL